MISNNHIRDYHIIRTIRIRRIEIKEGEDEFSNDQIKQK